MGEASAIAWTDVVTAVAAGITVLILVFAAFYARNQIKCNERTRQALLLADLSRRWDEERLAEAREVVTGYKSGDELKNAMQEVIAKGDNKFYILMRLPNFFETLGVLVNTSCIDKKLTRDVFSIAVRDYHELYDPTIQYIREISDDEDAYNWFDDLAEKIGKPVNGDS